MCSLSARLVLVFLTQAYKLCNTPRVMCASLLLLFLVLRLSILFFATVSVPSLTPIVRWSDIVASIATFASAFLLFF